MLLLPCILLPLGLLQPLPMPVSQHHAQCQGCAEPWLRPVPAGSPLGSAQASKAQGESLGQLCRARQVPLHLLRWRLSRPAPGPRPARRQQLS